jgi:hypothetical protein
METAQARIPLLSSILSLTRSLFLLLRLSGARRTRKVAPTVSSVDALKTFSVQKTQAVLSAGTASLDVHPQHENLVRNREKRRTISECRGERERERRRRGRKQEKETKSGNKESTKGKTTEKKKKESQRKKERKKERKQLAYLSLLLLGRHWRRRQNRFRSRS